MPTAKDYAKLSDSDKKKEDFMNSKWRPAMSWLYMAICAFDFILFPILWSLIQAAHGGRVETQWMPITLQGAGLLHLSFGAILGIAAYGRTQEKLAGVNAPGMNSGYGNNSMGGYNSPSSGYNSPQSGFGSPASNTFSTPNSPAPRAAYAGRPGPAAQVDPPL